VSQQLILPMIPPGATEINDQLCVWRNGDRWTYFLGAHPIYSHEANDRRMFRLITSQMIDCGACRLVDIVKSFGVSKSSVIRSLKKLRTEGTQSFFKARRGRRSASVMTAEVLGNAQRLLQQGYGGRETAEELGVPYDTFRKAIQDGRLHELKRQE
jgi:transposase-like protein